MSDKQSNRVNNPLATIPGFLKKAFEIFSNPEFSDMCGWNNAGDSVVIKKIEQFSKVVLPKYFKHSNFQSFVRQLNMYDFHKTLHDPNHGEFKHIHFKRGQPELLPLIKRKAHVKQPHVNGTGSSAANGNGAAKDPANDLTTHLLNSMLPGLDYPMDEDEFFNTGGLDAMLNDANGALATPTSAGGSLGNGHAGLRQEDFAHNLDSVVAELQHQQSMRASFEKRLFELEAHSQRVQMENEVLRSLVLKSRQEQARMQEKVTQVLYHIINYFSNFNPELPSLLNTSSLLLNDLALLKEQANDTGPIVEFPEDAIAAAAAATAANIANFDRPKIEELGSALIEHKLSGDNDPNLFRGISFSTGADDMEILSKPIVEIENKGDYSVLSPTRTSGNNSSDNSASAIAAASSTNAMDVDSDSYQSFLASSLLKKSPVSSDAELIKQNTLSTLLDESVLGKQSSLDYWGIRNIPIDQVDFSIGPEELAVPDVNEVDPLLKAVLDVPVACDNPSITASNKRPFSKDTPATLVDPPVLAATDKNGHNSTGSNKSLSSKSKHSDASEKSASSTHSTHSKRQKVDPVGPSPPPAEKILPVEYMDLLNKQQEATLCRIDSLQQALDIFLDEHVTSTTTGTPENGSNSITESDAHDKKTSVAN